MKKIVVIKLMYVLCSINNFNLLNKQHELLHIIQVACKKEHIENDNCDKNKSLKLDFSNLIIRPYFDIFLNKYKSKYDFYFGFEEDDNLYKTYEQLKAHLNAYYKYNFKYVNLENIDKSIKNKDLFFITVKDYEITLTNNKITNIFIDRKFEYQGKYDIITNIKEKNDITEEQLTNKIVNDFIKRNSSYFDKNHHINIFFSHLDDEQVINLIDIYKLRYKEVELMEINNDETFKNLKI